MANTLKIKRGAAATIPQGQLAEPLFTTDTYDLYIGKGSGGNQRIQNYIASGTSSQFLKGDGSLDSTTYQATSEKGQNNGYASLDSGGKVPAAQLPNSIMDYKGTWDASTNTPTLADGTGNAGDVYICSVGGTQNLGSGSITFAAGDWVVYSGSVWQKSINSNAVASVNGQTGAVVLYTDDISEDGSPTNLWFTNARARAALSATSPVQYNNSTGVISILDASASQSGVVTTGTQTFAGEKTFQVSGTYVDLARFYNDTNNKSLFVYADASGTGLSNLTSFGGESIYFNRTGTEMQFSINGSLRARLITGGRFLLGSQFYTDDGVSLLQVNGQIRASFTAATSAATRIVTVNSSDVMETRTPAEILSDIGAQAQLNGTGFVKATGTTISYDNSTYLTTSSAASTYLPLAGGTLTGALSGTSASFSGNISAARFTPTGATIPTVGMYSSASNYLDFSTNGTRAITISDGQKVGIGADPISAYRLYVNGDIYASGTIYGSVASFTSGGTFGGSISATSATFSGTTQEMLHVTSSATTGTVLRLANTSTGGGSFRFFSSGSGNGEGAGKLLLTYNGAAPILTVTGSSGNVGIGTADPSLPNGGGLVLYKSDYPRLQFRNSTSGTGSLDGAGFFLSGNNFYISNRESGDLVFEATANQERMRILASGDMYLTGRSTNGDYGMYFYSNDTDSRIYSSNSGAVSKSLIFYTSGNPRMTITSGGNVLIGGTDNSAGYRLNVTNNGASSWLGISNQSGAAGDRYLRMGFGSGSTYASIQGTRHSVADDVDLALQPGGADVYIGKSTADDTITGISLEPQDAEAYNFTQGASSGGWVIMCNRHVSDGDLITFRQANTTEGSISVSGTTVSYNGGHLARWSQTITNERIENLYKGTVMSNLDKMAEWINPETKLPEDNEQLNCMKISDAEGDINVAGVFVNWDAETNDMNIAMTGDMIIRIAKDVVVQRGQLLMSAGDGTAKPQGDDIIRDKTIAKVTSNHVTCVYEDGSYCVPCVLMAC